MRCRAGTTEKVIRIRGPALIAPVDRMLKAGRRRAGQIRLVASAFGPAARPAFSATSCRAPWRAGPVLLRRFHDLHPPPARRRKPLAGLDALAGPSQLPAVLSRSGDLHPRPWIQQVSLSWLVYRITGSAALLGVTYLSRADPQPSSARWPGRGSTNRTSAAG